MWGLVICGPEIRLLFSIRLAFITLYFSLLPNAFAAPPTAFDSWGGNGKITATCPTGFTCADNVTSDNMLQRILTRNSTSETYIQLIIQDGAVNDTGRFRQESFINGTSNLGGISSKTTINQTGTDNIDYTTTLNLGWANSTNTDAIDLNQTVTDNYQGVGFDYNFNYQQRQNAQGQTTGYKYGIRERVTNSSVLNGSNNGGQDIHTFVLRRAGGSYVTSGSASLPASAGGMGGGGGGMGAAVATTPTPATGGGTTTTTPAPTTGGNTMMGRTLVAKASSSGSSNGTTVSIKNSDFLPPPKGYGLGSGAAPGDPQTAPPDGNGFGPINNTPPLVGPFPGSSTNNNDTSTSNNNSGNTRSFGGGSSDSNGNASGPAAPTQPITAPTGNPNGMGMGGGPPGGTVSWSAGNEIQVIWIGQSCPGCVVSGGMGMGGGAGVFSFQQYQNISSGALANTRSIFGTAPFNWIDPPFGPRPGLQNISNPYPKQIEGLSNPIYN